jgi:hypothetical protein
VVQPQVAVVAGPDLALDYVQEEPLLGDVVVCQAQRQGHGLRRQQRQQRPSPGGGGPAGRGHRSSAPGRPHGQCCVGKYRRQLGHRSPASSRPPGALPPRATPRHAGTAARGARGGPGGRGQGCPPRTHRRTPRPAAPAAPGPGTASCSDRKRNLITTFI